MRACVLLAGALSALGATPVASASTAQAMQRTPPVSLRAISPSLAMLISDPRMAHRGEVSDVFVVQAPRGFQPVHLPGTRRGEWDAAPVSRADCEAQIKKAVCSTTASSNEIESNWSTLACDADSASFVPAMMDLFDETPEMMRPSICTLSKIFISDGITSTAFASPIQNGMGMPVGGFVGFRKGTFMHQPDSLQLVSWKEQLPFGGSTEFLVVDPNSVHVNYNLKLDHLKHDALYYVLMHELGHLIDFDNNITGHCYFDCKTTKVGWQNLSWESESVPQDSGTFFERDDFCYYDCAAHLPLSDALKIYQSLAHSAFVSTYAATNVLEDFAENWAWYQMRKFKSPHYVIQIPNQGDVDMDASFSSNSRLQEKMKFIDELWNSKDLKVAH